MRTKTFELLEVKTDGEPGDFTALASVFGNVDLVGDRMMKGAFKNTLDKWRESGDPIPVVLSHGHDDVMKFIGKADPRAVMETDDGLMVQGKLNINQGNPVADYAYKLMRERVLKGMSFAYKVPKGGEKKAEDGANEVSEVDLIEVGPTLVGANPEAHVQTVKSLVELPDEPLKWDEERREKFIADARTFYNLPAAKAAEEPPATKVEDRENEDRKASSERQDPLADEIARIEDCLAVGELP
jgi:HK97 family phage prohead protease